MHRCCLCPEHPDVTDLHHIVFLGEGGPNTLDNLMVVCPTCHAKIHRIRQRYTKEQLRMYKERWVHLCGLGLPLDVRMAQASDYRNPPLPPGMPAPPAAYFAHPYPLQQNFTGRVRERKMLTEWLTKDNRPLFAYVALGGMGKSAVTWAWVQRDVLGLSLPGATEESPEIARSCGVAESDRPEGILWWSFYERESTFESFVRKALSYVSAGSVDPSAIPSAYARMQALYNSLSQRRFLIVLDGVERILRAYARLDAAYRGDEFEEDAHGDFRSCTDPYAGTFLQWLASRTRSKVLLTSRLLPRELESLGGCHAVELKAFAPEDGVAFFRAQGVTKETHAQIEAACEPYGYHPLALRLLSGLIAKDKRQPGDIEVAKRCDVVPSLKGKEHHHILQVAYDHLDEEKRKLVSSIAAFRSPVAYETVAVFNPYKSDAEFDDALDELIVRGLLLFDRQRGRYDMPPIVRQYTYDRLRDKAGVHTRLRDYFAAVPAPEKEKVQSVEDLAPVIELYHHTVRAERYDEAFGLFRDWFEKPLYHRLGHYPTCIKILHELFPGGKNQPPPLKEENQILALRVLGACISYSGASRCAIPLFDLANGIAESKGDLKGVSICLRSLALSGVGLGEFLKAAENLSSSITLSEKIKDRVGQARGRRGLGLLLAYRGEFEASAQEQQDAEILFHQRGEKQNAGVLWANRSLHALLMGDTSAARKAAQRARSESDTSPPDFSGRERDIIRAEWLLGAAIVQQVSSFRFHGPSSGNQPETLNLKLETLLEAERHLTRALSRCRRISLVELEPDILLAWARWHFLKGNSREARQYSDEALAIADRCEYRLCQADIHNFLARLALETGDQKTAIEHAHVGYERAWCDGPPHAYKPALDEAQRLLSEFGASPPALQASA
jgi:tetratricopeptide (TPR) repeat protein